MKANELRIGNYVQWDNDKNEIEVINVIRPKAIGLESDIPTDFLTPLKSFQHIPLTEQWLLDFGFEKVGDRFSNWSFVIKQCEDKSFFYGYIGGNIEIKTVSHLQNVYYFLTGNELNK